MKRTVGAMLLLAGLGGCVSPGQEQSQLPPQASGKKFNQVIHPKTVEGFQGPMGQPIPMSQGGRAILPGSEVVQASARMNDGEVVRASGHPGIPSSPGCDDCGVGPVHGGYGVGGHPHKYVPQSGIPNAPIATYTAPPGAVAAVGAMTNNMTRGPINARTSVRFVATQGTEGMKVSWLGMNGFGETVITTPGRYNFIQGGIYRLKLSDIATRPTTVLYPTIEVMPATHQTAAYLAHSSVPVGFTQEDLDLVEQGNYLVKVLYLPDPQYQELALFAGPSEISTRLEPGIDPILEAEKRGTILLIVRMGNIDLQAPNTPAMDAPNPHPAPLPGGIAPGTVIPAPVGVPLSKGKQPSQEDKEGGLLQVGYRKLVNR